MGSFRHRLGQDWISLVLPDELTTDTQAHENRPDPEVIASAFVIAAIVVGLQFAQIIFSLFDETLARSIRGRDDPVVVLFLVLFVALWFTMTSALGLLLRRAAAWRYRAERLPLPADSPSDSTD